MVESMNVTLDDPVSGNSTLGEESTASVISRVIKTIALPSVCAFGVVGNILNLTILTRRKLQKSFRTLEQAANLCLIALALSDLMFCLLAFLTTFLPRDGHYSSNRSILVIYDFLKVFLIDIFIMESTLLVVAMSLERFMAICFPLRKDLYLTTCRIKYVIAFTIVFSVFFNVPVLFRHEITPCCNSNSSTSVNTTYTLVNTTLTSDNDSPQPLCYTVKVIKIAGSDTVDNVYRWVWAVAGNFVPLILLIYFNIRLLWKIYHSKKIRRQFHRPHQTTRSSHILTITLVAIVVMFFILVAPSETVFALKNTITVEQDTSDAIDNVLNLMQAINFSMNFILYCTISPYFRKTLKYSVLRPFSSFYRSSS